jgi:hypothetical protein
MVKARLGKGRAASYLGPAKQAHGKLNRLKQRLLQGLNDGGPQEKQAWE